MKVPSPVLEIIFHFPGRLQIHFKKWLSSTICGISQLNSIIKYFHTSVTCIYSHFLTQPGVQRGKKNKKTKQSRSLKSKTLVLKCQRCNQNCPIWKKVKHAEPSPINIWGSFFIHYICLTPQSASRDGLPPPFSLSGLSVWCIQERRLRLTDASRHGSDIKKRHFSFTVFNSSCLRKRARTLITPKHLESSGCYSLYSRNCCNFFWCSGDILTALMG